MHIVKDNYMIVTLRRAVKCSWNLLLWSGLRLSLGLWSDAVAARTGKKAEHLYSALHGIPTTLKRSGMDHKHSF